MVEPSNILAAQKARRVLLFASVVALVAIAHEGSTDSTYRRQNATEAISRAFLTIRFRDGQSDLSESSASS